MHMVLGGTVEAGAAKVPVEKDQLLSDFLAITGNIVPADNMTVFGVSSALPGQPLLQ